MCACCLLFRQVQYEAIPSTVYGYSRVLRVDDGGCESDTALHFLLGTTYVSCSRNTALAPNLLILPLAVGRMGGCRALVGYCVCVMSGVGCWTLDALMQVFWSRLDCLAFHVFASPASPAQTPNPTQPNPTMSQIECEIHGSPRRRAMLVVNPMWPRDTSYPALSNAWTTCS
jgi:hypothetical protein